MSRRATLVLALAAVALVGAGVVVLLEAGDEGACGAEVREPLDPRSLQHVLPGAPEPAFTDAAPTSGPHQPSPAEGGVRDAPVPGPLQVGALEGGAVLVQYRPDLSPSGVAALRTLAGGRVIVAPNPGLTAPTVATAWRVRLTCRAVDMGRLRRFVTAHAGTAAAAHP